MGKRCHQTHFPCFASLAHPWAPFLYSCQMQGISNSNFLKRRGMGRTTCCCPYEVFRSSANILKYHGCLWMFQALQFHIFQRGKQVWSCFLFNSTFWLKKSVCHLKHKNGRPLSSVSNIKSCLNLYLQHKYERKAAQLRLLDRWKKILHKKQLIL